MESLLLCVMMEWTLARRCVDLVVGRELYSLDTQRSSSVASRVGLEQLASRMLSRISGRVYVAHKYDDYQGKSRTIQKRVQRENRGKISERV